MILLVVLQINVSGEIFSTYLACDCLHFAFEHGFVLFRFILHIIQLGLKFQNCWIKFGVETLKMNSKVSFIYKRFIGALRTIKFLFVSSMSKGVVLEIFFSGEGFSTLIALELKAKEKR